MTNFIIDVEAAGRTPMTGLMTEFGVVELETGESFYAHLYDTYPIKEGEPFIPQVVLDSDLAPVKNPYITITDTAGSKTTSYCQSFSEIVRALKLWTQCYGDYSVAISDNNGFDMMWLNCFIDEYGDESTNMFFGHSSRRIGDLYSGYTGKFKNTSRWKKYRKTPHDHNPVNDALGNREALLTILDKYDGNK